MKNKSITNKKWLKSHGMQIEKLKCIKEDSSKYSTDFYILYKDRVLDVVYQSASATSTEVLNNWLMEEREESA